MMIMEVHDVTRDQLLGRARADLAELAHLVDQLDPTERHHDLTGYHLKVVASPALVELQTVHLLHGGNHRPWDGEDPRHTDMTERYRVALVLAGWTRVVAEEAPHFPDLTPDPSVWSEASVLVEYWPWIVDQPWAKELAEDITKIAGQIRAILGIRPEYRPRCRWCGDVVNPVEADNHRLTTWEACAFGLCAGCGKTFPKGPALDALAQVQPPMPLTEISELIGVPISTLHRWHTDGLIAPVEDKRRHRRFDLAAVHAVARLKFGRALN